MGNDNASSSAGSAVDVETAALDKLPHLTAALEDRGSLEDAAYVYIVYIKRASEETDDPSKLPEFALALERTAYFLARRGDRSTAIRSYDQIIQFYKDDRSWESSKNVAHALFSKGVLKKELGEIDAALAAFEDVIRKWEHMTEPSLRRYVVLALHSKGNILCSLAGASYDQNKFNDGIRCFVQIIERFSDDDDLMVRVRVARSLDYLAQAYQGNGETDKAWVMLGEIIRRFGAAEESELRSVALSATQTIVGTVPSWLEPSKLEQHLRKADTQQAKELLQFLQYSINEIGAQHRIALDLVKRALANHSPFVIYLRNFDTEAMYREFSSDSDSTRVPIVAWEVEHEFERDLIIPLSADIPIVGMCNHDDLMPRLPGGVLPKIHVPVSMWMNVVRALVNAAQAIIVDIDEVTEGICIELEIIREQQKQDASVIMLTDRRRPHVLKERTAIMIREAARHMPDAEVVLLPGNVTDFLIANTAEQAMPVISRDAAEQIPEASAVLLNPQVSDLRGSLSNREVDSRADENRDHTYPDKSLPILEAFENVFFKEEVPTDMLRELEPFASMLKARQARQIVAESMAVNHFQQVDEQLATDSFEFHLDAIDKLQEFALGGNTDAFERLKRVVAERKQGKLRFEPGAPAIPRMKTSAATIQETHNGAWRALIAQRFLILSVRRWFTSLRLHTHITAEARARIPIAIALARWWSILSNVFSAASDKAGLDRAMRPSRTMHSSSATDDTASITSSEGSARNRPASIGRASILPICPRAHAADFATAWFRSSRRSVITAMSPGRRQAQRQALARTSGSACRRRDRKTSSGSVACSCAATATARPSAGPCTTPRTINRDIACAASRLPITASARRAADCSGTTRSIPNPAKHRQSAARAGMAAASRLRAASAARAVQSPRFVVGIAAINASSSRSTTAGRRARSCGNGFSTGMQSPEKRSSCCSIMLS